MSYAEGHNSKASDLQEVEYNYRQPPADNSSTFNNSDSVSEYTDSSSLYEEKNPVARLIDSFKPIDLEADGIDTSNMTEMEKSIYATSRHPLAKRLKSRHLQMISIGGSIGTGLFVGMGFALSMGGPAGVIIAYSLVGYSMYCVVNSLGEMSAQYPVSGSFNAFFSRFIDPSWGFTLGILYAISWLISFPSELIACALTIQYWNTSINGCVWVAIFYVVIATINLFGVKGFGEAEFVFSLIKVLGVVGFVILGICIICGVGDQGYIGGRYFHNPGAFNHGFKGVCSVFISAAFSFGGCELVALAASETKNPGKSLPKATKQVFWRIALFYFTSSIVIGCLVPYTDDRLLNGSGISASPFVIAINNGGIKVVPHIMNAVVLIAVLSVGNSSVYGCSRTIASLAVQGLIPKVFGYIDRSGRPLVAIMFTNLIGLLGFLAAYKNEEKVFTWLFSICSLSSFFTWSAICFTHVRFRMALRAQGRGTDEVIFVSPLGLFGSISGLIILILIIIGEIWISIWPIGSKADVVTFWQNCLSLPLMIVMWLGYKVFTRSFNKWWVKLEDIDLDTGRREVDLEVLKQEIADDRRYLQEKPFYYKVYRFFC